MLCQVYKSPRKADMYLYVAMADGLERVPESLYSIFGEPEAVLMVNLDEGRKLARADAGAVKAKIEAEGYYLQMPPGPENLRRRDDG